MQRPGLCPDLVPPNVFSIGRSMMSSGVDIVDATHLGWRKAPEGLGEVVRGLGAVPAEDVTTWRAVASDAGGSWLSYRGDWSARGRSPRCSSDLLARSAQGPRQDPVKPGYFSRGTIRSAAALMAQADLEDRRVEVTAATCPPPHGSSSVGQYVNRKLRRVVTV